MLAKTKTVEALLKFRNACYFIIMIVALVVNVAIADKTTSVWLHIGVIIITCLIVFTIQLLTDNVLLQVYNMQVEREAYELQQALHQMPDIKDIDHTIHVLEEIRDAKAPK